MLDRMDELLPKLAEPLITIVVVLLTALSAWVGAAIKAKVQNDLARGLMERLHSAVETAVISVGSTLRQEILRAKEDGRITSEEAAELRDAALRIVKLYLGEHGTQEIERVVGVDEFKDLVFSMIEAELEKLKQ